MPAPALHFKQFSKAYGKSVVLNGLDLDVQPGEFFGLVGVNGAGKTTLIKCLMDFSGPDQGGIEIFGVSHRQYQARAAGIRAGAFYAPLLSDRQGFSPVHAQAARPDIPAGCG